MWLACMWRQFLSIMLISQKKLNCHLLFFYRHTIQSYSKLVFKVIRIKMLYTTEKHSYLVNTPATFYHFAYFYVNPKMIVCLFTFLNKAQSEAQRVRHIALCIFIILLLSLWNRSGVQNQRIKLKFYTLWQHIIIYNLCEINCVQLLNIWLVNKQFPIQLHSYWFNSNYYYVYWICYFFFSRAIQ